MLTLNHLGNLGRLANQMFQYASLKGIAKNRGYEFMIPPKEVFGRKDPMVKGEILNLYDVFDIEKTNKIGLGHNPLLQERTHEFDEELFANCPDNVDLLGYYQTQKYFEHIEDEIRYDFSFTPELQFDCRQCYNENFGDDETIALHIRRGDYVSNPNHPVQTASYYKKALKEMPADIPVVVFSDDSEWCKEQKIFEPDRFFICEGNTSDADLCLMSLCTYHIIANSSFSWWGAWLGRSEKIIAPKKWFGGDCVNKSVKDIEFGNWSWI
jgi:hypothetical protein